MVNLIGIARGAIVVLIRFVSLRTDLSPVLIGRLAVHGPRFALREQNVLVVLVRTWRDFIGVWSALLLLGERGPSVGIVACVANAYAMRSTGAFQRRRRMRTIRPIFDESQTRPTQDLAPWNEVLFLGLELVQTSWDSTWGEGSRLRWPLFVFDPKESLFLI